MKTFYELLRMNLKIYYYYRWNYLLAVIVDPVLLIIQILLIRAVYTYNTADVVLGYDITRMIWYFAAVKFYSYLVWSFPDQELARDVIFGTLGVKLVRPVSLLQWEFIKTIAGKICTVILTFVPGFIVFSMIVFPGFLTPAALLKYLILNCFAFVLFYLMSFLLGIAAIRWQNNGALGAIKMVLMNVASGAVLPLEFFPGVIQSILKVSPFPYLSYIPIRFFLNLPQTGDGNAFIQALLVQTGWIIIFYFLCRLCWFYALRFHTVAGG